MTDKIAAPLGVLDILLAGCQWLVLLLLRLVLILLGFPVVAVAIHFAAPGVSLSDGRPIVNLPRWVWLWGNDFDGLDGDRRRWWADNCDALVWFGLRPLLRRCGLALGPLPVESWSARWWWAAVRNPANNLRFLPWVSCPVSECDFAYLGRYSVEDKPGKGGWQFVRATRRGAASRWYGFYAVRVLSESTAAVLRLGFKIKPEHQGTDEPAKGMTFKVNPAKSI
ncbi:hypothetical protein D3C77_466680 [compost metagenome]